MGRGFGPKRHGALLCPVPAPRPPSLLDTMRPLQRDSLVLPLVRSASQPPRDPALWPTPKPRGGCAAGLGTPV